MGIRQGVVSLAKPTASRALWPPGHSTDSLTEARQRDMCTVGPCIQGFVSKPSAGRLDSSSKPSGPGHRRSVSPVSHFLPPCGCSTFTMSSPFLKLCKSPLFPTLPQASHLNKYFLISIIQDFFFLHTDSSFTFKTLTFSCPVAGQPSEWTLHSTPFCLAFPTPQAFPCAPHSRSSLICYSTPTQCRHGLTPSQVISPQHPKHLPFGPLSTQTFSEHTCLDGTSRFRPGSQHLSQQASELKPDYPKPQSEQEVLHVHHGEHSLPQREQGP